MRHVSCLVAVSALLATPAFAAPPAPAKGAPINANMGVLSASGSLTDTSGKDIGTWSVKGKLSGGKFTGDGTVSIQGQTFSAPLRPERSYFSNDRCVFYWEEGRARAEISGACNAAGIGGYLNAFIPTGDVFSVNGYAAGSMKFAVPGRAPATGVVPTARLTCAWMERIGGVVAGQDFHYELRPSNMGFLQLTKDGRYTTSNTKGQYVRGEGDTIKFTSGQFAGATGHLQPDNSGQPAVHFEREENRTAKDVHIVDPQRTSCTAKR